MAPIDFLNNQKHHSGKLLSLAIALGSFSGLMVIGQAWCLAQVVNKVIFEHQSLQEVLPWMGLMLFFLLIRSGLGYFSEQIALTAAAEVKQNLRERLFQHIQALGPTYLGAKHSDVGTECSGELSATIIDGVESLEAYFSRYLPAMSLAVWIPLAILVFVFPMDWKSALVMLVTAPLIPFFMILIGKSAEKLNQQQWQQLTRMGGHFLDMIQGLTTLKLYNASKREGDTIARISENYRHATMKVLRVAFLSSLALEFFATISIAIVAVLIGFRLLFGEMDFLNGFFILLLAPEFYLPLRTLGTHYHSRMSAVAASERIIEILDTPISQPTIQQRTSIPSKEDEPLPIRFENIVFSYNNRPALNGINFDIQANQKVALIGSSGAGKTTIINMLLGFIKPDQGNLSIDGLDITRINLQNWRRQLAWVPQRPRLFHGSIADNISLGLEQVSKQRLIQALTDAQAIEFVNKLPNGLATIVGEGGRQLSGGQVQRLALARAFLRDAKLLILDEPTAHLDQHNQELIQEAICKLSQNRSVLTVAHQLSTIHRADLILVLDKGKIVQQGNHRKLLSEEGLYQELINATNTTNIMDTA